MDNINDIFRHQIEHIRQELYTLMDNHNLSDEAILEVSQDLDELILQYYRKQEHNGTC